MKGMTCVVVGMCQRCDRHDAVLWQGCVRYVTGMTLCCGRDVSEM